MNEAEEGNMVVNGISKSGRESHKPVPSSLVTEAEAGNEGHSTDSHITPVDHNWKDNQGEDHKSEESDQVAVDDDDKVVSSPSRTMPLGGEEASSPTGTTKTTILFHASTNNSNQMVYENENEVHVAKPMINDMEDPSSSLLMITENNDNDAAELVGGVSNKPDSEIADDGHEDVFQPTNNDPLDESKMKDGDKKIVEVEKEEEEEQQEEATEAAIMPVVTDETLITSNQTMDDDGEEKGKSLPTQNDDLSSMEQGAKEGEEEESNETDMVEKGASSMPTTDSDETTSTPVEKDKQTDETEQQPEATNASTTTTTTTAPPTPTPASSGAKETTLVSTTSSITCDTESTKSDPLLGKKELPLVVDEEAATTTLASSSNDEDTATTSTRENPIKRTCMGLATFVLVALAVVLPVAFFVREIIKNNNDDDDDTLQQGSNSNQIVNGDLVPGITNYTLTTMINPYSPQAFAYNWIAADPKWDTYDDWRKQQRFAMACVFYSFSTRFPLYHERHECDWRYRRQVTLCTEDGEVRGLSWTNMMWTELNQHIDSFLPAEIHFLPQLERLDFSDSVFRVRFEGEYSHTELDTLLPLHIPNSLSALKVLKASDCTGLQGSLPSTLGLLTSLTRLDFSINELTATIPTEVGLLSDLSRLDLSNNALTGTIPSELGLLDDLGAMMVQANDLSGTIPVELGELPLLNVFVAEENELEPFIPPGFCRIGPMSELSTDWCWIADHCCN